MKIKTKRNTLAMERAYLDDPNISDDEKRSRLVLDNIGIVYGAAHKYAMGYDVDDFISEGTYGLIRAAELFKLDSKHKFASYAQHWVKKYMILYKTKSFRNNHISDDDNSTVLSLNYVINDDDTTTLNNVVEDIKCEGVIERSDSYEVLFDALEAMDPRYKKIILLHIIEGKTFKEVAKILGKTLSLTAYYYRKGIEILKNELKNKGIHSLDDILKK